jgi:hypothetical protein
MLSSQSDAEGFLHLKVPVALPNAELKVIVTFQPILPASANRSLTDLGWSPGFFEQTAGAWEGEPLCRGEQGEYEVREELWQWLPSTT